jgi:hypothetical protein
MEELRAREMQYRPDPAVMTKQEHVTTKMRLILLDWLLEVSEEHALHRETFHVAANAIDRFLDRVPYVARSKLQLVGVAALYIASKAEEIHPPKAEDFVQVTDCTYSLEQLRRMERYMLKVRAAPVLLGLCSDLTWLHTEVGVASMSRDAQRMGKPVHRERRPSGCFASHRR